MEIKVKINPEYIVYPDFENNLELPESGRFGVVINKVKQSLHSYKWQYEEAAKSKVDYKLYIKNHIVKLVNPFPVSFDDGKKRLVTLDDIFSDVLTCDVFDLIINAITDKVIEIRADELDIKK